MNLRGSIEWKKPDTEQYIPFGSIYTNFQAELTRDDRGQNSFTSNEALSKEEHRDPAGSWEHFISQSGFWLHIVFYVNFPQV